MRQSIFDVSKIFDLRSSAFQQKTERSAGSRIIASMLVECQIPQGHGPGSTFQVQVNGQIVQVQVPPNGRPGQSLRIQLPPSEPVIAHAVEVPQHRFEGSATEAFIVVQQTNYVVSAQPGHSVIRPGRHPFVCTCPFCNSPVTTRAEKIDCGLGTWAVCGAITCVCPGPWCFVAFCIDDFKGISIVLMPKTIITNTFVSRRGALLPQL